jgi:hypothetical protein
MITTVANAHFDVMFATNKIEYSGVIGGTHHADSAFISSFVGSHHVRDRIMCWRACADGHSGFAENGLTKSFDNTAN